MKANVNRLLDTFCHAIDAASDAAGDLSEALIDYQSVQTEICGSASEAKELDAIAQLMSLLLPDENLNAVPVPMEAKMLMRKYALELIK